MLSRNYLSYIQSQARYRRRIETCLTRYLCSTPNNRILVGPPDPVSNLRPVIYDDDGSQASGSVRRRKGKRESEGKGESEAKSVLHEKDGLQLGSSKTASTHPYLLDEFDGDPLDYQWRIDRSRLDAYNHAFWTDSNTRFEEAKQAVLSSLPENSSPEAKEAALSEFYGNWLRQEQDRLKNYADEWSRRNYNGILLAARVAIHRFRSRIFGYKSPSRTSYPPRRQNNNEKQN